MGQACLSGLWLSRGGAPQQLGEAQPPLTTRSSTSQRAAPTLAGDHGPRPLPAHPGPGLRARERLPQRPHFLPSSGLSPRCPPAWAQSWGASLRTWVLVLALPWCGLRQIAFPLWARFPRWLNISQMVLFRGLSCSLTIAPAQRKRYGAIWRALILESKERAGSNPGSHPFTTHLLCAKHWSGSQKYGLL